MEISAVYYLREILIVSALLLSVPLINMQKRASDRNVLRGIRSLFFLIIFTYLLLVFSSNRLDIIKSSIENSLSIYDKFSVYVLLLSWAFFIGVFILIVLGTLKNLIFIKQKKSTARNFSLLLILLLIYPALNNGQNYFDKYIFVNDQVLNSFNNGILFLLVLFMVLNVFRVSWINYLNKKQKLACFWAGLLLLPMQYHFAFIFHSTNPAAIFSPILGDFINYGVIFLTLYLTIAFLSLLAHLPTAQLFDRKMHQIGSLHDLSRAVSSEFDLDKLVVTTVRLAAEVTEADFAWLELVEPNSGKLKLASSFNLKVNEQRKLRESFKNPIQEFLSSRGEPFLANQAQKNQLAKSVRTWKKDLNSLLAVPLKTTDSVIGYLYAGQRVEFGFEQDDIDMLRAFGQQVVIAVENARLVSESIIKERLEQELKVAHDAQMKLLPKEMPQLPGFEIEAICVTANEVGGDYFDFFKLEKNKLGIVIGDVSGKGASAAFYMAEIKGVIGALARGNKSPKQVLIETNKTLFGTLDKKIFITAIYGILDIHHKSFTFCRAGHCPLYFVDEKNPKGKILEPKGIGLGLVDEEKFAPRVEEIKVKLISKSTCLLFTDGVNEARNIHEEEFGEKRLFETFVEQRALNAKKIKEHLIKEINTFGGFKKLHDDYSFIIIKTV